MYPVHEIQLCICVAVTEEKRKKINKIKITILVDFVIALYYVVSTLLTVKTFSHYVFNMDRD